MVAGVEVPKLPSALRRLELGSATERDRERVRGALRAQETRLRELAFFEARRAEDATKVTSGRVT